MAAVELAYDLFDTDVDPNACPIILMHGYLWNKFMFRDVAKRLSQAMKCRVYSLDLRNHGESPKSEEASFDAMVNDVKKLMHDKGIEKATFVTHSISGAISYLFLLDEPDKVHKLVMVDYPIFLSGNEMEAAARVSDQVMAQNQLLRFLDPKMTLQEAKTKFNKLALIGDSTSQEYFLKKAAYDLTKVNRQFTWKIDLDFLLRKYTEKTYVIKSRGSSNHEILVIRCINSIRVWDEKFDAILKHNPRAKLVTFENATHSLMFERTDTFIEVVTEFLSFPSDGLETRRTV